MSELSKYRITDEDMEHHGVIAAPDRLTGTAAENKAVFDRMIREAVKEKYNAMLTVVEDELNAISVWEPYDAEKEYVPGNKVVCNGSSYLCKAACRGVLPTDGAAYWLLVAARGVDGTGAGDMRSEFYDPRGVETDVFTYIDERFDPLKEDTFTKPETLAADTAQAFVDGEFSLTAPGTPNEAFGAIVKTIYQFGGIVATISVTAHEGADVSVTLNGFAVNTHAGTGSPVEVKLRTTGSYIVSESYEGETSSFIVDILSAGDTVAVDFTLPVELVTEEITESGEWEAHLIKGDIHIRAFGGGAGGGGGNGGFNGGGGGGHMKTALFSAPVGKRYQVTIGSGGDSGKNGGPTSFGNIITVDGGGTSSSNANGGNGGSGGGGGYASPPNHTGSSGGNGSYGGGGGAGALGVKGGDGGEYGGGGGAPCQDPRYPRTIAGKGGEYGGDGGASGADITSPGHAGDPGTNTVGKVDDFPGQGIGGSGAKPGNNAGGAGGGGGGYGGNGGNATPSAVSGWMVGGAGGGGGYGGNGGNGGNYSTGGGGGGYGLRGNGGDGGDNGKPGGNGGIAAGGGGGAVGQYGGKGGNGIIILTYRKYVTPEENER